MKYAQWIMAKFNHLPFIHECNLISLKNQCSRKYDQWIKVHYYYNRHIIAKNLFFRTGYKSYMCKLGYQFRLIKHCILEDNVTHDEITLWRYDTCIEKWNLPYLDSWKVWTWVLRLLKNNCIRLYRLNHLNNDPELIYLNENRIAKMILISMAERLHKFWLVTPLHIVLSKSFISIERYVVATCEIMRVSYHCTCI